MINPRYVWRAVSVHCGKEHWLEEYRDLISDGHWHDTTVDVIHMVLQIGLEDVRFPDGKNRYTSLTEPKSQYVECDIPGHDLSEMRHYGYTDDGLVFDYGPTGFLECSRCGGIAKEPE